MKMINWIIGRRKDMARRGGFPGGHPGGMNNMMKQAQEYKQMEKRLRNLKRKMEASSGSGAVTVKISERKEVVSVNWIRSSRS